MATVRIEVLSGESAVQILEPDADVIRIGRGEDNDVVVDGAAVAREHAHLIVGARSAMVYDLGTVGGTLVERQQQILPADPKLLLHDGDTLVLGTREGAARIRVEIRPDPRLANVLEVRPLDALSSATESSERNAALLKTMSEVQRAIGSAENLGGVLSAVGDAALKLVPRATHATLVLRDEAAGSDDETAGFVPMLTRVRGKRGTGETPADAVPVARSVFRKVVTERAAVLAADAPAAGFDSESMLGAHIHSTIGVPLWKGDRILGVLQVDSRGLPAMFDAVDVEVLGVLAQNASLAVDNARLIDRLRVAERTLEDENRFLKGRDRQRHGSGQPIIGQSGIMATLFAQMEKVADTRATVLIEGETGTGKELVAFALHERSRRRERLFVAQNCAALPDNLLESELFGHKRGAFTGATEDKRGLFELADGGTLFLDEVTEMPAGLQAKLLRALQEGEIRQLGAPRPRRVDVRVVAATNRDLELEVREGRFREDLFYRLRVFPLTVPPLRERRSDIPLLAGHFLTKYSTELGKPITGYAQETMELLMDYGWRGNVRELENEVQRLVIQADPNAFITPDLLSPRVRQVEAVVERAGAGEGSLKERLEQVEKHLVLQTLREHDNNKTSAAKALGITREGLHKKLRQLKIG